MITLRPGKIWKPLFVASSLIVLAACSTLASQQSPIPSDGTSSNAPTNSASSCTISTLTGQCTSANAPVMIVKIDDVGEARPQFFLNEADLMVVEPVEGGLTRLFAVYQSELPEFVGPVRSARITDIDLGAIFGEPGFVYSGSATRLRPFLNESPLQLVGMPQGGEGYERLSDRNAPHNLIAYTSALLERVKSPESARLPSAKWNFSSEVPKSGVPAAVVEVAWPSAKKKFVWRSDKQRWQVFTYQDNLWSQTSLSGERELVFTDNVFIMEAEFLASPFGDRYGGRTPYPKTFGNGEGWVLTGGKAFRAKWQRPSLSELPVWTLDGGGEVSLRPGKSWWVIVENLGATDLKLRSKG